MYRDRERWTDGEIYQPTKQKATMWEVDDNYIIAPIRKDTPRYKYLYFLSQYSGQHHHHHHQQTQVECKERERRTEEETKDKRGSLYYSKIIIICIIIMIIIIMAK